MTDAQLLAIVAAILYKRWDDVDTDANEALQRAWVLINKAHKVRPADCGTNDVHGGVNMGNRVNILRLLMSDD